MPKYLTNSLRDFYNMALLYDGDECLPCPQWRKNGSTSLWCKDIGKTVSITRLLCIAQNGPPPSVEYHAHHTCRGRTIGCCNKKHFTWLSPLNHLELHKTTVIERTTTVRRYTHYHTCPNCGFKF